MDLSKKNASWYAEPDVSWTKAGLIFAVWTILLIVLIQTPFGRSVQEQVEERLDFNFREVMDMAPPISPKLKIILFGDQSLARIGNPDLPVSFLTEIINKINSRKPRVIVIDRLFSTRPNGSQDELDKLAKAVSQGAPTYIASFTLPSSVPFPRSPLPLNEEYYRADYYLKGSSELPEWITQDEQTAYGASEEFRSIFISGHAEQFRFGKFLPFIHVGKDKVIPHFTLMTAEYLALVDGDLIVNWRKVPVNRDGAALFNTRPFSRYSQLKGSQVMSLYDLIAEGGEELISPGDTVLFVPHFFTGNTDLKDTPIGKMAGGLLVAAALNSVLTGDWLQPIDFHFVFVLVFGMLGIFVGMRFRNYPFWLFVSSCLAAISAGGLWLFASEGLMVPWFFCDLAFFTTALTIFAERARIAEKKSLHLRIALRGSLPPKFLNRVTANPSVLDSSADQRVVTIMFVDVVGFSRYAEKQAAIEVFTSLKDLLNELTQTIHRHEGVVNRTLGDGLLAFFGYNYVVGEVQDPRHAIRAMECALEIQRKCVELCVEASKSRSPVYPLRIGINTAAVQIGDLGDAEHVDFTLIGHGVNFAKRLEESCENFRILISEGTHRAIEEEVSTDLDIRKRLVLLKHQMEPTEVFEINPFEEGSQALAAAGKAYWEFAGIRRRENRICIPQNIEILVNTSYGMGRVVNFSKSGMAFELETYLAKGMELEFSLRVQDGSFDRVLNEKNINPILGELRSGFPVGKRYRHGMVFKNLSTMQKDLLFFYLAEEITRQSDTKLNRHHVLDDMEDAS